VIGQGSNHENAACEQDSAPMVDQRRLVVESNRIPDVADDSDNRDPRTTCTQNESTPRLGVSLPPINDG